VLATEDKDIDLCALPGNAPDCAIGALISPHGHNVFRITQIAAGVSFHGYRKLKLI
jgi:hypothetical protein